MIEIGSSSEPVLARAGLPNPAALGRIEKRAVTCSEHKPRGLFRFGLRPHSYDDVSLFGPRFDISVRLDDLFQRIASIDDGS
jgi:hypothetical protein